MQLGGNERMVDVDDDGTHRVAVRGGSASPFAAPDRGRSGRRTTPARGRRASDRRGPAPARRRRDPAPPRRAMTIAIPRRLVTRVVLAVAVLGVAVVLIIAAVFRDRPVQTDKAVQYAAAPPAEWSADARWRTPALLPRSGPALVIGADRVAVVTADRHLMLIQGDSGNTIWSAELPAGDAKTDLASTTVDGRPSIAVQLDDRLCWWAVDDAAPRQVDLPPGSRSTFLGESPLIGVGPSTVATIRDGSLVRIEVPTGAVALAARSGGQVTAASSAGWWHLRPDAQAGPPTPWESISRNSVSPTVISYAGGQIITAATDKAVRVLVYSDRENDVRFNFGGVLAGAQTNSGRLGLAWHPAPSGQWGILSRTMIDLSRGRLVDLGDWTTQHVASDRALGTIGGKYALVGPDIPRGQLIGGEGFPEDLTSAGALVRARENGSETLYLLPPRMS